MGGVKLSFAVVAFVLVQGIGVIWYVSKLDSRVDQMYKSFEEENKKDVIENQVKMKIDLENLMQDVKQNRSIEKQHRDLFKFLEKQQKEQKNMNKQSEQKGGYSYGD